MYAICYYPSTFSFWVAPLENLAARGAASFPLRWLGSDGGRFELVGHAETVGDAMVKIEHLAQQVRRAGKKFPPVVDVRVLLAVGVQAAPKGMKASQDALAKSRAPLDPFRGIETDKEVSRATG